MLKQAKAVGFLFLLVAMAGISIAAAEQAAGPKSLYDRLGGEPAIKAVVEEFVNLAAADPKVNFTREGTGHPWQATPDNLGRLKTRLVQFIAVSTGAKDVLYSGADMKSAHEGMEITDKQFDALAADLKTALTKFNVPAKEQDELLAIVGTTRGMIVEKKPTE